MAAPLIALAGLAPAQPPADAKPPKLELVGEVAKIRDAGKHNAFTDHSAKQENSDNAAVGRFEDAGPRGGRYRRRIASFSVPLSPGSRAKSSRSAQSFMQNSAYKQPSHLSDRMNGRV